MRQRFVSIDKGGEEMKTIIVDAWGKEVELREEDVLDMTCHGQRYKLKIVKIGDGVLDILASDNETFDENSRLTKDACLREFQVRFANKFIWDYIIDIKRGGKVIDTFHPY